MVFMKQKHQQKNIDVLGVSVLAGDTYLFTRLANSSSNIFSVQKSSDGEHFIFVTNNAQIIDRLDTSDDLKLCANFYLSRSDGKYYLTYTVKEGVKNGTDKLNVDDGLIETICVARSYNLVDWEKVSTCKHAGNGVILSQEFTQGGDLSDDSAQTSAVMYCGGDSLKILTSTDFGNWNIAKFSEVIKLPSELAKLGVKMTVVDVRQLDDGIWITYSIKQFIGGQWNCDLYTVLCDSSAPEKVLWWAREPIFTIVGDKSIVHDARIVGFSLGEREFLSYWQELSSKLFFLRHILSPTSFEQEIAQSDEKVLEKSIQTALVTCVERAVQNPIMSPQRSYIWESKYVFNPAAIYEGGEIHILYRAIGEHDVSVLGYASTQNGVDISRRLPFPAYVPRESFEGVNDNPQRGLSDFYASGGGGWGGCEDPKLTRIDDKIYLVYVAYNGWSQPRLAMSWIEVDDFLAQRWNWSQPVLISRPGETNKSGCILPEKVNGKYMFFHRVFPDILIDFVDDLDFDSDDKWLEGKFKISPRPGFWDAGKLSVAAPPMRTDDGWLMIYHAVTGRPEWEGTDLRYKIGAMILDIDDPTKVLYRTSEPLLEPETHYENEGAKYGIAYPCGAVIKDGELFIYYGGSDEFVCVATAPLAQFLKELKETGKVSMSD